MRSVLDALFCETVEFTVPLPEARKAYQSARCVSDGLIALCALAGIELMDYDSHMIAPEDNRIRVTLRSRLWRERLER